MIDPAILAELWRAHAGRLLVIARSVGEPAEDAVQEAFTSLATQGKLPDDPLAWLVRVSRNQLLSWQRKRQSQANYQLVVAPQQNWFSDAGAELDSQLDGQQVTVWLQMLPTDERQVIVMHLWGGLTFRQIAATTDCSLATANRLYHSGLERLRSRAGVQTEVCHES
ncbi:RNA polymerase sigma factor [Planctomycetaceae bacterium SH139]